MFPNLAVVAVPAATAAKLEKLNENSKIPTLKFKSPMPLSHTPLMVPAFCIKDPLL